MTSPTALVAHALRREFGKSAFVAVDDVSLRVEPGHIHALLGPNGAGKTTTVRMCATLLEPTSGSVSVAGIDAVRQPHRARRHLGLVLGGELGFYGRASARDNLGFFADLQGVSGRERRAAIDRALALVDLADSADVRVQEFSRGMTQRLHLARAALTQPELLLLDEPTTGLDPDIALRVRDVIREFAASGIGVLLTSHSMPEVEELADVISVIGAGRIVTRGNVADIAAFAGIGLTTSFSLPARASGLAQTCVERLGEHFTVKRRPQSGRWALSVYWPRSLSRDDCSHTLSQVLGDVTPTDLVTRPASLEEAYLALAERLSR
ncbi:ABC transporter ATP-binding protein [Nanchangia anserum]|uniref:ABC transporter ATP-binding protein n=1 Tax=Nanchangia anserum TaxID=2692125 RepID=A0A8I0G740_9ACTO|nr:ABC transporter ATP-binding protein [Nanchangia anserum]MBD3689027.1 ABC transporter ATP-binding protein [Nanchangia anserum]QOX81271.1 ABC transporter ATP-binding protein [Nanchangia anserum]